MKTLLTFALALLTSLSSSAEIFRPKVGGSGGIISSPAVRGTVIGAIAGAVVGNNTGGRDAGRGAAIGAVSGFVLGSVAGSFDENRPVASGYPGDNFGNRSTSGSWTNPAYSYDRGTIYRQDYRSDYGYQERSSALSMAVKEANSARRSLAYAQQEYGQARARLTLAAAKVESAEMTVRRLQ